MVKALLMLEMCSTPQLFLRQPNARSKNRQARPAELLQEGNLFSDLAAELTLRAQLSIQLETLLLPH